MLGGGMFVTQNKVLPGTYHNFISAAKAFANLSNRGYVALPDIFDWFADGVTIVTAEEVQNESLKILGYSYNHDKLLPIREVLKNAHTLYLYAVNEGATAARNDFAIAKKKGVRGNDIKIIISANVDEPQKWDVSTYLENTLVDVQTVTGANKLVANDYVTFESTATLIATAGAELTGGSNGAIPTATPFQNALNEFESFGFNALVCTSTDNGIKGLFVAYTKRMRDEVGSKFQLVGYQLGATDHEGVIDVHNSVVNGDKELVYWAAGAAAGCAINKTNTNKLYDGEYEVDFTGAKTQYELSQLLKGGKLVFHRVGTETRVLEDINTFVSFTSEKSEDFSMNQVIRVLDQIAIDTATLFNTRYLGKVPNDDDGRVSLWSDIGKHRLELQRIRAIQNYQKDELSIVQGDSKKSVAVNEFVDITVAMSQLYITTTVA